MQNPSKKVKTGDVVAVTSRAVRALFTVIRDTKCDRKTYNIYCDRLCTILAEEGLAHLKTVTEKSVTTPCGLYRGLQVPSYEEICAISIMRSGDILLDAVRRVATGISVGKILMQRDEEDELKRPKLFYSKLPEGIATCPSVLLVDPMLATGGSAILAIKVLLDAGVKEDNILFLVVVAAPEGIKAVHATYPGVKIVTAEIDEGLNGDKYIVPGLGDFGDRYYGT